MPKGLARLFVESVSGQPAHVGQMYCLSNMSRHFLAIAGDDFELDFVLSQINDVFLDIRLSRGENIVDLFHPFLGATEILKT
jgi:hypothetical protein